MKIRKETELIFQKYYYGDKSVGVAIFIRSHWNQYKKWSNTKTQESSQ